MNTFTKHIAVVKAYYMSLHPRQYHKYNLDNLHMTMVITLVVTMITFFMPQVTLNYIVRCQTQPTQCTLPCLVPLWNLLTWCENASFFPQYSTARSLASDSLFLNTSAASLAHLISHLWFHITLSMGFFACTSKGCHQFPLLGL